MTASRTALLDTLEARGAPPEGLDDTAWVDVIQKMEEVYSRLIDDEVELEKKNAQLEQSQQFIESVLSAMTDVLIVCDESGKIVQANAALCRLVGQAETQLLGMPLRELLADEASRHRHDLALQSSRQELEVQEVELLLQDAHQQGLPVDARCTPRTGPQGHRVGWVWVGRPMAELKRAYRDLQQTHRALQSTQQQLIHSEKMASLGQLVAGVAHELNNPISFVLGNVHALQRYCLRLREYIAALEQAHAQPLPEPLTALQRQLRIAHVLDDLPSLIEGTLEGANRTADIVQGLKQFSARDYETRTPVDLETVVERALRWMKKGQPPHVRVDWQRDPQAAPALVMGSDGQLQQVVMNLLQNAFDALTSHGASPHSAQQVGAQVHIAIERDGAHLCLRVRDNGPGIAAEHRSRLFDPFFTTKPVGKGTGLGLSISYGIVEQHGGELCVSNHVDCGAEFVLRLPICPAETQKPPNTLASDGF
jgi:two-component system sensor histidine kinase HupT/HoxJ